jgi:hypothetical protein
MSLMLTIVVAFGVYKYIYGMASSNKLTPITPIVDERVQELSCENQLKNDSDNDDDSDYFDDGYNPIVTTVDMSDFQPIKDDKGSDSESNSSNDHFDTVKDKDSENIDRDKDKSKSDNSTGICYISDNSSLSVFDHSSIRISEEDIDASPITPIVDEGVQVLSCENQLKNDSDKDDNSGYNPIVITVDMNDFQPIKDDKGSDSESDSSNDHFDTFKDKDSDNIDHDKDKSKSDNSIGSCYISDNSSLSVFDHSSICISEEDIDTISDIIQDSTETDEDDVETSNSEFDISISSSDSEDSCALIMSNLMGK